MKKFTLLFAIILATTIPAIAKTKVIAEVNEAQFNGIIYKDETHHIEGLIFYVPSEKKANDLGTKIARTGDADHLCLKIGEKVYYLQSEPDKTYPLNHVRITQAWDNSYEVIAFVRIVDREAERFLSKWQTAKDNAKEKDTEPPKTEGIYLLDSDQFDI